MTRLKVYGWFVLFAMLAVTAWASIEKSVGIGFSWLLTERWGIATLMDAGFGFLFFFLWICTRERSLVARAFWFVFVLFFGNIAMAIYFLRTLYRLPPGATAKDLFSSPS